MKKIILFSLLLLFISSCGKEEIENIHSSNISQTDENISPIEAIAQTDTSIISIEEIQKNTSPIIEKIPTDIDSTPTITKVGIVGEVFQKKKNSTTDLIVEKPSLFESLKNKIFNNDDTSEQKELETPWSIDPPPIIQDIEDNSAEYPSIIEIKKVAETKEQIPKEEIKIPKDESWIIQVNDPISPTIKEIKITPKDQSINVQPANTNTQNSDDNNSSELPIEVNIETEEDIQQEQDEENIPKTEAEIEETFLDKYLERIKQSINTPIVQAIYKTAINNNDLNMCYSLDLDLVENCKLWVILKDAENDSVCEEFLEGDSIDNCKNIFKDIQ